MAMFIPRQVQKPYTTGHPAALPKSTSYLRKPSPPLTTDPAATNLTKPGTLDLPTAQAIVLALEQLFSSENPHSQWLEERRREVDGHDDYLHLAAVIECPYFRDHRPQLTQIVVRRALEAAPSEILETSRDRYHIRLAKGTKTALRESHTVYIEPSITNSTRSPGKLALELQKTLPPELLPVKYTATGHRSWTLITLSAPVSDASQYQWPPGWIVLSQPEWKRRDSLYRARRQAALDARSQTHNHPPTTAEEAQKKPKHSFEPGLIVHVSHLHPDTNKPSISSFIMRSVDRYVRKRHPDSTQKIQINYIDYKKGTDSCFLRQATAEDSALIVAALKKRKREMREGADRKGRKVKEGFVQGRVLEGEEERAYWEKVEVVAEGKKGKKKGEREGGRVMLDVRGGGEKRHRVSEAGESPEGKRKRFEE